MRVVFLLWFVDVAADVVVVVVDVVDAIAFAVRVNMLVYSTRLVMSGEPGETCQISSTHAHTHTHTHARTHTHIARERERERCL